MSRNGWGVVRSLPSEGRACSGVLPLGGIVSAMLVLGGMLSLPPLGARLTLFQPCERAHLGCRNQIRSMMCTLPLSVTLRGRAIVQEFRNSVGRLPCLTRCRHAVFAITPPIKPSSGGTGDVCSPYRPLPLSRALTAAIDVACAQVMSEVPPRARSDHR